MQVAIPSFSETIPLFVLFRAMGIERDEEIEDYCTMDGSDPEMLAALRPSKMEASSIQTTQMALSYLVCRTQTGSFWFGSFDRPDKSSRSRKGSPWWL